MFRKRKQAQAGLAVFPSHAVPLEITCSFTRKDNQWLSRTHEYVLVRDAVFFVVDFFTGDKAPDLGRLLASQVIKLRYREGYVLRFTLTKTLPKGLLRSFALIPFCESEVCLLPFFV